MTRLSIERLKTICSPELLAAILEKGKVEGDFVEILIRDLDQINQMMFSRVALGELIHHVAKPIAKVLGLTGCGSCEERRLIANQWTHPTS